jgi:hypothetical protein
MKKDPTPFEKAAIEWMVDTDRKFPVDQSSFVIGDRAVRKEVDNNTIKLMAAFAEQMLYNAHWLPRPPLKADDLELEARDPLMSFVEFVRKQTTDESCVALASQLNRHERAKRPLTIVAGHLVSAACAYAKYCREWRTRDLERRNAELYAALERTRKKSGRRRQQLRHLNKHMAFFAAASKTNEIVKAAVGLTIAGKLGRTAGQKFREHFDLGFRAGAAPKHEAPPKNVNELGLPFRAQNRLLIAEVFKTADLLAMDDKSLLAVKGVGHRMMADIDAVLAARGLRRGAKGDGPRQEDVAFSCCGGIDAHNVGCARAGQ